MRAAPEPVAAPETVATPRTHTPENSATPEVRAAPEPVAAPETVATPRTHAPENNATPEMHADGQSRTDEPVRVIKERMETADLEAVLNEAMAYLTNPSPANKVIPAAKKQRVAQIFKTLRQAQEGDPNNAALQYILQLYTQRYLIYAGLFGDASKANKMTARLHAMGLPAFHQTIDVKGKKSFRVCVGPFLKRTEAMEGLKKLRKKMRIKDAFMRIHKG